MPPHICRGRPGHAAKDRSWGFKDIVIQTEGMVDPKEPEYAARSAGQPARSTTTKRIGGAHRTGHSQATPMEVQIREPMRPGRSGSGTPQRPDVEQRERIGAAPPEWGGAAARCRELKGDGRSALPRRSRRKRPEKAASSASTVATRRKWEGEPPPAGAPARRGGGEQGSDSELP